MCPQGAGIDTEGNSGSKKPEGGAGCALWQTGRGGSTLSVSKYLKTQTWLCDSMMCTVGTRLANILSGKGHPQRPSGLETAAAGAEEEGGVSCQIPDISLGLASRDRRSPCFVHLESL